MSRKDKPTLATEPTQAELEAHAADLLAAMPNLPPEDQAKVRAILAKVDPRPELEPAEQTRVLSALNAIETFPDRAKGKFVNGKFGSVHKDDSAHFFRMKEALHTSSDDFAVVQLTNLVKLSGQGGDDVSTLAMNSALAFVASVEPRNELEAAMAVQMAGTHGLSVEMMAKARQADQVDALERYVGAAVKLQRTFTAQVEALAKLRSAGRQLVEVVHVHKHVYVAPGGQAVVGDIYTQGAGGGGTESGDQSHAAALSFDPGQRFPEMRCEDAIGEAVHVASGAGTEALPDARRR